MAFSGNGTGRLIEEFYLPFQSLDQPPLGTVRGVMWKCEPYVLFFVCLIYKLLLGNSSEVLPGTFCFVLCHVCII